MPALRFRDRFFTKPVARAVSSPSAIVAAGAGAAAGILVLGPVGAVLGLAAYGARVLLAVPRKERGEAIDPSSLSEPWRHFVREALQARSRFTDALRHMRPGPLHEHLSEIGGRLDEAVDECWRVARRGQALSAARAQVQDEEATRQLNRLQSRRGGAPPPDSTEARTMQALQSQVATGRRMDAVLVDTHSRLQLLDARMDEAVTRALELSVHADAPDDLGGLGHDVDVIVSDMEALRQALDEASGRTDLPGLDPMAAGDPATGRPPPTTWPPSPPPGRQRPA